MNLKSIYNNIIEPINNILMQNKEKENENNQINIDIFVY